ncbi:MAG: hypothetical protein M5U26_08130 [Planctomycetota bacterium]|nr:hypothetical protein [Planctomycetota bacterium]
MSTLVDELAKELKIASEQVAGALELLNAGYPPIFVARYRKERTGGLGEGKLWAILDRQRAYDELNARRRVILNSLQAGGQLTDELKAALEAAPDRARIEDLYLPFAPGPRSPRPRWRAKRAWNPWPRFS